MLQNTKGIKPKKIIFALLALFNLSTVGSFKAEEILHIGAIPDQNPEHLNRLFKVLSSELSEQLNVQVRYKPVTNYAAAPFLISTVPDFLHKIAESLGLRAPSNSSILGKP